MPVAKRSDSPTRRRERMRLGGALRRAWIGYQLLLEEEMGARGVRRRDFPDARVLRLCKRSSKMTISAIGYELGMTRQGASKIVKGLRERGFVTVQPAPGDGRERLVLLTPAARTYLDVQRKAARTVDQRLRAKVGGETVDALYVLLEALAGDAPRLPEFLHKRSTALDIE